MGGQPEPPAWPDGLLPPTAAAAVAHESLAAPGGMSAIRCRWARFPGRCSSGYAPLMC